MDQRKGFILGLPVGAVVGALIALAVSGAFGGDSTNNPDNTDPAAPDLTIVETASPALDDNPQIVVSPGGAPEPARGPSAIPNRNQANTVLSTTSGIYADNGTRLTGSDRSTAFVIQGMMVYQFRGKDQPLLLDRGAGADLLASSDTVEIKLMSVGFKDGAPLAIVKLLEPTVAEGVETIVERIATIGLNTGDVTDYGIMAGFESTVTSASISPTGFILGVRAEGDAFLTTLSFEGEEGEVIVPCFDGTCPRRPWVSADGTLVAYLSGLTNLAIYDLERDRVVTEVDLGIPADLQPEFPGWAITDFFDLTVAVSEIRFDPEGTLVYGEAKLVSIGGEITPYGPKGAVTFVR